MMINESPFSFFGAQIMAQAKVENTLQNPIIKFSEPLQAIYEEFKAGWDMGTTWRLLFCRLDTLPETNELNKDEVVALINACMKYKHNNPENRMMFSPLSPSMASCEAKFYPGLLSALMTTTAAPSCIYSLKNETDEVTKTIYRYYQQVIAESSLQSKENVYLELEKMIFLSDRWACSGEFRYPYKVDLIQMASVLATFDPVRSLPPGYLKTGTTVAMESKLHEPLARSEAQPKSRVLNPSAAQNPAAFFSEGTTMSSGTLSNLETKKEVSLPQQLASNGVEPTLCLLM
jgi:hypothetical protein